MATREERLANRNRRKGSQQEQTLRINVDTSPDDEFRQQQEQDTDQEAINIERLTQQKLLNDEQINGNKKKIFHEWNGENLDIDTLENVLKESNTNHYVQQLLAKYPNKNNLLLFGKLSLKCIYYVFHPETDAEAAFIINTLREGYKIIWKRYINSIIRVRDYKKTEIQNILKKNTISVYDSGKSLLSIAELKKLLYSNFHINIHVLNPIETQTHSNSETVNANQLNTSVNANQININNNEQKNNTESKNSETDNNNIICDQLITLTTKDIAKYRKILRSEMMELLRQNLEFADAIIAQIDLITSLLEAQQLVEVVEQFDELKNKVKELRQNFEREIELYKAAPRRQQSKYSGRPHFIYDLQKRIKQYNNEKEQIIKRLWELSQQTRSPILLCMASGPCYGVTSASKGTVWVSPPMQLTGIDHAGDMQDIWKDYLKNNFAPQRDFLQSNYEYAVLENKLKQIVDIAEKDKLVSILSKLKEMDLGYLLQECDNENIILTENQDSETQEMDIDNENGNIEDID